jgi:hypothetical protein
MTLGVVVKRRRLQYWGVLFRHELKSSCWGMSPKLGNIGVITKDYKCKDDETDLEAAMGLESESS